MKNALGVVVTRPTQELIIMSGIPGAGKSTKAKSLVGQGVIHSTDDLIEKSGDYRGFFAIMVADQLANKENPFLPLQQMHSKNLTNAISSMKSGISPVIVDNTNIKQNESKAYVIGALEMGFADDNIKFVDIGTAGLCAEELAERNTHGVPLDKIKQMINNHTTRGKLTLKSVLSSKDMYKESNVLYSAVVLDNKSRSVLLNMVGTFSPKDWLIYAHHMTIIFGKGIKDKTEIGKVVTLTVTHVGLSNLAMAVKVCGYESTNKTPHITISVNLNGGKPKDGNDITRWREITPFNVTGIVTEIKK